ncbi:MAG: helix-hairpin-helix domain-containing protein, partial [Gemmatimonadales bacterium]
MISEVLRFLEGRTGDVRDRVREMMLAASDNQDFERARKLRDTLRWLDQLEAPAPVEAIGGEDADVIGFVRDGDEAVGVVLRVRDGKLISREHRFLENLTGESEAEVLSAFLVRYYIPSAQRVRRILLPFPPEDFEALSELVPDARWAVPQRGKGHDLAGLAEQNARHLMESLRLESFEAEERAEDPVYSLGRDLGMSTVPRSLICIDISTSQGRDTVGSLVWFEAGRPKKSGYRKFRIKGPGQQDDFAAIKEVVERYFIRRRDEGKPLPDLVVIDGGKGQLSTARDALAGIGMGDLPLISLAKREEEIFLPGRAESLRLPRRSPGLRLLQRARDEAHRFGVTYNRKRRTQRTITSELLDIPGIGPERRRRLLERFGSLAGVRTATAPEIATVPGFS